MNLAKVHVTRSDIGWQLTLGGAQGSKAIIDVPTAQVDLSAHIGQEVLMGLRAEAICLSHDRGAAGPLRCAVRARVEVIEPTGSDTLVVLQIGGVEFTARLEPDAELRIGQDVDLLLDLSKLVCFDLKTEARIGA